MRIPFIAANWKMFKTVQESVVFAKEFRSMVKDLTDVEIVDRAARSRRSMPSPRRCGTLPSASPAQNLHWEREGAFTGEGQRRRC